jgi:hypothetical protein
MSLNIGRAMANLDVACPPVQVEVQVFDFAPLSKHVLDVIFAGLFVDVGDDDNPPFNAPHGDCTSGCASVTAGSGLGGARVDFHFARHGVGDVASRGFRVVLGGWKVKQSRQQSDEIGFGRGMEN